MAFLVNSLPYMISIGNTGENAFRSVEVDVSEWIEKYPNSDIEAVYERADGAFYPLSVSMAGRVLKWIPKIEDVQIPGEGKVEFRVMYGDVIGKSATMRVRVNRSLDKDLQPVPEGQQSWVTDILRSAQEIKRVLGKPYVAIKKKTNYLYETWYDRLDYQAAYEYFNRGAAPIVGACSAVRKGNWFGRNYDWFYNETAEFIVHTPRIADRYASVGVCGSIKELTQAFVDSGADSDLYKILPFQMQDGINEFGLVASMNVVPNDKGTNRSEPTGELLETVSGLMLIRYLLDYFASAADAVGFVSEHMSVYFPKSLGDMGYEIHYMIADPESSYLLEFINNEAVVVDVSDGAISPLEGKAYITNFYLSDVELNADGSVYTPETMTSEHDAYKTNLITKRGSGLERYNRIVQSYSAIESLIDMRGMMDELKYTRAYPTSDDPAVPVWYTEFVGIDGMSVDSPASDYADVMDKVGLEYSHRSRASGKTWHTAHSSVYDIENKELHIVSQESGIEFAFNMQREIR